MPRRLPKIVPVGQLKERLRQELAEPAATEDDWRPELFELPAWLRSRAQNQQQVRLFVLLTILLNHVREAIKTVKAKQIGSLDVYYFEEYRDSLRGYLAEVEGILKRLSESGSLRPSKNFHQPPFPQADTPTASAKEWCHELVNVPSFRHKVSCAQSTLASFYIEALKACQIPTATEMRSIYAELQREIFPEYDSDDLRPDAQGASADAEIEAPPPPPQAAPASASGPPPKEEWSVLMGKKELAGLLEVPHKKMDQIQKLFTWRYGASRQQRQVRIDDMPEPYQTTFRKNYTEELKRNRLQ